MHKQLGFAHLAQIPNVNFFENSMKSENSVDPDQLASSEAS